MKEIIKNKIRCRNPLRSVCLFPITASKYARMGITIKIIAEVLLATPMPRMTAKISVKSQEAFSKNKIEKRQSETPIKVIKLSVTP